MNKKLTLIIIVFGFMALQDSFIVKAQDTTQITKIQYTPDFRFNNGIFLTFENARDNNAIPFDFVQYH